MSGLYVAGLPIGCEACVTCAGCEERWCREQEVSPGEADGICPSCWDADAPSEVTC